MKKGLVITADYSEKKTDNYSVSRVVIEGEDWFNDPSEVFGMQMLEDFIEVISEGLVTTILAADRIEGEDSTALFRKTISFLEYKMFKPSDTIVSENASKKYLGK